jgi:hypothetical protein
MKDFPYGEIVTELPANYAPPEMWPEYEAVAMPRTICKREKVGINPEGIRWSLWPITFEEYVGDQEPDLAAASGALARNRLVMWKRLSRTDAPKGWRLLSRQPWRVDGFFELHAGEDYKTKWQKQARRDLRMWQEHYCDKGYAIEAVSLEEYVDAYKKSTVNKRVGRDALDILLRKYAVPLARKNMTLWGVRNTRSGQLVAGISPRHSPTFGSSTYEAPFILPEAKKIYAMTALIDHWFAEAREHSSSLLVFNSFWQPGEPRSWKAFSLFKSHFGPKYVAYPPTLWRFVRGKIF